jgi:hypothetical protein
VSAPAGDPGRPSPPPARWRRLWQPQRPAFWLLVAFNLLSSGFAWALRTLPLHDTAVLIFGALALLNALLGLVVFWRLWQGH